MSRVLQAPDLAPPFWRAPGDLGRYTGPDSLKEIAVTTSVTGSRTVIAGLYTGCGCGVVCGVVRESSSPTSVKNSNGKPLSWPFPIIFSFISTVGLGRGVVVVVVVVVDVVVVFGIAFVAITDEPILLLNTRTMDALEDLAGVRDGTDVTGAGTDVQTEAELLGVRRSQVLGVVEAGVG